MRVRIAGRRSAASRAIWSNGVPFADAVRGASRGMLACPPARPVERGCEERRQLVASSTRRSRRCASSRVDELGPLVRRAIGRKAATSSGVGNRPVRSRRTRRRNAASSGRGETGMRRTCSVLSTSSSMKFARGSPRQIDRRVGERQGQPDRHDAVEESGDDDVLPAAADGARSRL